MYTQKDVEQAVQALTGKTLFFEGAGCVERGDVENCRIRTAFRNDEGAAFYLELSGMEVHNKSPKWMQEYSNVGFVDYCYTIVEGEKDCCGNWSVQRKSYEYSKAGILEFVNRELGCSFTQVVILDVFDGYHVHNNGGYNFIEDYTYNPEKAAAARETFHKIDMEIRKKMCEKYSQISLSEVGADSITVRCYASDKKMLECGMNPDERFIVIPFGRGRK